jgi:hypothetical protein
MKDVFLEEQKYSLLDEDRMLKERHSDPMDALNQYQPR